MATKINVTLTLDGNDYNLLKSVADYTGLSRSECISRLLNTYAVVLMSKNDTSTTQGQTEQSGVLPMPATQNPKYDFFTKTDRLILEDKAQDAPIYEDYGQSSDDTFPDDLVYGPIED